jgi:hypothetical protein
MRLYTYSTARQRLAQGVSDAPVGLESSVSVL